MRDTLRHENDFVDFAKRNRQAILAEILHMKKGNPEGFTRFSNAITTDSIYGPSTCVRVRANMDRPCGCAYGWFFNIRTDNQMTTPAWLSRVRYKFNGHNNLVGTPLEIFVSCIYPSELARNDNQSKQAKLFLMEMVNEVNSA